MTRHTLAQEFSTCQGRINLGPRVAVAKAAHEEVRSVLRASEPLAECGLSDVLIGSYARDTTIWPGKDVDIFGKLAELSVDMVQPDQVYEMFHVALAQRYRGRLTLQPRSIKIAFSSASRPAEEYLTLAAAEGHDLFEFSVDVVPAVRFGSRWAIPRRDRNSWSSERPEERWVATDPERLSALTTERNSTPRIQNQGAFVPTVKAIRQIRKHHLGRAKPGSLFYEFMLHQGFQDQAINGKEWADITAAALAYIARRLRTLDQSPVCDPVLLTPYSPAPDPTEIGVAAERFDQLADQAAEALEADRCMAGALWRQIFGTNGREPFDWVFPVPINCRDDGTTLMVAGANPLRGSDEARGFGHR